VSGKDAGFYQVTSQSDGARRETGPAEGIAPALPRVIPPPLRTLGRRSDSTDVLEVPTLHSFAGVGRCGSPIAANPAKVIMAPAQRAPDFRGRVRPA
jgi:hypothetical protein